MKDLDINKGMCGIYGCLSSEPQNLIQETLRGLKILQYRGYDSAGIAYSTPKQLKIVKAVGDIEQLIKKIPNQPKSKVCIGHTRWATNGTVNIKNSHPHISHDGKIAVVHNGIIENYKECCKLLLKNNISLKTPVDTEVIPNILCLLSHNKHDICNFLKGQYVFCATEKNKNNLFLAKKGNLPLYIGHTKNTLYITSDTLTLPDTVTEIITMEDMDTCEITENKLDFYHKNRPIEKAWQPFNQSFKASNKNGFSTYMEKEINEIPTIINRIVENYQNTPSILNKLNEFHKLIKNVQCVHICGCGTSYHAGLVLSQVIEENLHIRAIPHISSELSEISLLNESAIAIVISQSGETADTLACMDTLEKHHIPILALCNVLTSTIANRSQITFPLLCGPEIAVASTKVFCAAILVGCLMIKDYKEATYNHLIKDTNSTLQNARKILPLPQKLPNKIFIIGKGLDYVLALEAALKIKEVTYLHCEAYPANELKHGPLSMVDNNTLAIIIGNECSNAISEIQARGGKTITISTPNKNLYPLYFVNYIIPAQIFALELAQLLGYNPDKPRNLAKSVTVL